MKQILFYLVVLIACFSSCANKDIELEANEQLKLTMREKVKRPDDATLANVHTVYKSDSLCILHFTLKGKNALDMETATPIEYIFIDFIEDGKRVKYEAYTDLDPLFPVKLTMNDAEQEIADSLAMDGYDYSYLMENTVESIKNKYRNNLLKDAPYSENDPNIEDRLMFSAAWLRLHAQSRDVTDSHGKDIKL